MRNAEGDGICCDYCNAPVRGDFVYYSLDFFRVAVSNRVKDISQEVVRTADLCQKCMDLYKERVIKAYKPPVPNKFCCDISGAVYDAGNIIYYQCKVSMVTVTLTGAASKCIQCTKLRTIDQGPCPDCTPETRLIREAVVDVDSKYLEINFSEPMFAKFEGHLTKAKELGASQWSAQT